MPAAYTRVDVTDNGVTTTYWITSPVANVTDANGKVTGWTFKGRRGSANAEIGDVELTKDEKDFVWYPAT